MRGIIPRQVRADAYQIALQNGFVGTKSEWLASLKGADGNNGQTPYPHQNGNWYIGDTDTGMTWRGQPGTNGAAGLNGAPGKNAYEIAQELGYAGTLDDWLASLKGTDGKNGINGKSAYRAAVDSGYTGTESDFGELLANADAAPLRFLDVSVPVSSFASDNSQAGYPYKANIPLTGALEAMDGEVVFPISSAGNYAVSAYVYDGGISIWATKAPSSTLVIPKIILRKGGSGA